MKRSRRASLKAMWRLRSRGCPSFPSKGKDRCAAQAPGRSVRRERALLAWSARKRSGVSWMPHSAVVKRSAKRREVDHRLQTDPKKEALRNLPMFPNIKYWIQAPCRGLTMTSTCTRNTCMIQQLSPSVKTTRQLTFRSASSQPNYKAENIIS